MLFEAWPREAEHEQPAIDAGIHVPAVAPARVAEQPHVRLALLAHNERNPELTRQRPHVAAAGGRGLEMETDHVDPLLQQEPGCERAVQPARKQP